MATLSRRDKVVDNWGHLVENGAGRDRWILDKTDEFLKEANPPNVVGRREEVSASLWEKNGTF